MMAKDLGKMVLGGASAPSVEKGVKNLSNASLNPNKAILDEQEMQKNELMIEDMKRKQGAPQTMKKGGKVKVSSASKRADGCATKGKTRGRMV
jgi:hypothetical protein